MDFHYSVCVELRFVSPLVSRITEGSLRITEGSLRDAKSGQSDIERQEEEFFLNSRKSGWRI
jgi:hypothetical protein